MGTETTATLAPGAEDLLHAALAEDLGDRGDITTALTLGGRGGQARARITAKESGRLSGLSLARRSFEAVDDTVVVTLHKHDGDAVEPGDLVLEARGPAASLLESERTALNFLGRLSGVASATARFVERVAGTRSHIVDTRKTTPGWRLLEKQAVVDGGGHNHRIGLYDEVMLKENHFAMAPAETHAELVARVKQEAPPGTRIIAEAENLDEAWEAADGGADVILLDNFPVELLAAAVERLATHARRAEFQTEASGGVNLDTVAAIAATGVDRISVGAITHSAPSLDLSQALVAGETS